MTNDEAIRLARTLLHTPNMNKYEINIRQFCDYILSGDMKREIENAAYRHALREVEYAGTPLEAICRLRSLIESSALGENKE